MTARFGSESLAAAAAALAVAAAVAAWLAQEPRIDASGGPRCALAPVVTVSAALPAIDDIARFEVGGNPFIPQLERLAEQQAYESGEFWGGPLEPPKHRPVPPDPPPKLAFPAVTPMPRASLGCLGVVAARGAQSLLVRLPSGATTTLAVGDAVPLAGRSWILEALEPGGVARFRDPDGSAQRLAVGGAIDIACGISL